jgi:hypothetical protein
MSGFHLVPYQMTFGRSAWQDIKYYRAQRAAIVADAQSLLDTGSSSLFGALQNQVSGAANNAAQVALNRINALAQATQTNVNSQISQAQTLLSASSGSSVNTVA